MQLFFLVLLLVPTIAEYDHDPSSPKAYGSGIPVYENQCPRPFTAVVGGHCYFLSYGAIRQTWKNAQLLCSWLHPEGRLAEFEDEEELVDATRFLVTDSIFGNYTWTGIQWVDVQSDAELPFICEVEANPSQPPPVILKCPNGFFQLSTGCYLFRMQRRTWDDSKAYCSSLTEGGRLVEFETQEEYQLLIDYIPENGYCGISVPYGLTRGWDADQKGSQKHFSICEADLVEVP
ncbi:unnamed protein product [Cyprideis torosa]|uniref:Uncharacterized protein n=1 Tax=Cyprideis torosa TaxID=163714 RepID=A0A7R8ZQN5_9CRUS|nr:unnamed protein product [Cyprideis torosa]CAG0896823.1 unnamed protein product [Cyprideis torosa]